MGGGKTGLRVGGLVARIPEVLQEVRVSDVDGCVPEFGEA